MGICWREGLCKLKRACVRDRYARRIDRFFEWNPELADQLPRPSPFRSAGNSREVGRALSG